MSVLMQLNRPTSAAVTAVVIPTHTYSPKVYVTCRNVSVQTEAIRCAELFDAEANHDGDMYLKVFHNADTIIGELSDDRYGEEQFWLDRHAQETYFLYDSDEDPYGYARARIYHRNREGAPQSVVWRSSVEAEEINFNTVSVNAISGLWARNFAVQTNPAQIPADLSLTTLFAGDVIEWDN